jgi:hypothetical protein
MEVNGPISEELKEPTVKVQEHWSDPDDEIMHVESVVDCPHNPQSGKDL